MCLTPQQAAADPRLRRRPSDTHRQVWLGLLWGPLLLSPGSCCSQRFVCAFQESLAGMGFDFTVVAPLLPSRCSVSSVLRHGVCFLAGSNALLSMAVQPLLVILVFSQERMSARPSALSSWMCSQAQTYVKTYHIIHFKHVQFTVLSYNLILGFPGGSDGKASACNARDLGSIPGLGRCPGGGHGNPLQCSCLEILYGQRSLASYRLWGRKESDMTERLTHTQILLFSFTRNRHGQ